MFKGKNSKEISANYLPKFLESYVGADCWGLELMELSSGKILKVYSSGIDEEDRREELEWGAKCISDITEKTRLRICMFPQECRWYVYVQLSDKLGKYKIIVKNYAKMERKIEEDKQERKEKREDKIDKAKLLKILKKGYTICDLDEDAPEDLEGVDMKQIVKMENIEYFVENGYKMTDADFGFIIANFKFDERLIDLFIKLNKKNINRDMDISFDGDRFPFLYFLQEATGNDKVNVNYMIQYAKKRGMK